MKWFTLRLCVFSLLFSLSFTTTAQNISGIWKGYFITENGEQYKLEFQIGKSGAQNITGVSYSYLDIRFYGKSSMTGQYTKANKTLAIQELRTMEVKSTTGGGTCLMNYKLVYSVSGRENYLEGTYLGKSENRIDPSKNGTWGDCGGGKVFLRRVETSDFYVEPFLKDVPVAKAKPPVTNKTITPPVVKTPQKKPVTPAKKPVTTNTGKTVVKKPVAAKTTPVTTAAPKTKVTTIGSSPVIKEEVKKVIPKPITIPVETRSRQNETAKVFTVTHQEVTVKLYDNGEVDGDTISVYLDNQLILSGKRLSTTPITLTVQLDEKLTEHVLVMVAENMGRIPPNTALMIVQDGDNRYQAHLTSTEQKNAMVRFRYQKQSP
jgi:hypothetical protein